jgi:hypothetical protein
MAIFAVGNARGAGSQTQSSNLEFLPIPLQASHAANYGADDPSMAFAPLGMDIISAVLQDHHMNTDQVDAVMQTVDGQVHAAEPISEPEEDQAIDRGQNQSQNQAANGQNSGNSASQSSGGNTEGSNAGGNSEQNSNAGGNSEQNSNAGGNDNKGGGNGNDNNGNGNKDKDKEKDKEGNLIKDLGYAVAQLLGG